MENRCGQGVARDFDRAKILIRYKGEFDAFAHGVDAFGAHADLVAEVPFDLTRFCAATGSRTDCGGAANDARTRCGAATAGTARSAATSTGQGDDGVIALAKDAARAGEFFQSDDGKKAFHEDLEKLDEAAVFLDGNNQAVIFLAEVLFHELSGLPVHEFALGAVGAALGFRGSRSDFFQIPVRI